MYHQLPTVDRQPSSSKKAPDPRNNIAYTNPATVEGVYQLGNFFMNRGTQKLGKLGKNAPKEMRFCAFYGAPVIAVFDA
jgi:hypothetical protein